MVIILAKNRCTAKTIDVDPQDATITDSLSADGCELLWAIKSQLFPKEENKAQVHS